MGPGLLIVVLEIVTKPVRRLFFVLGLAGHTMKALFPVPDPVAFRARLAGFTVQ
jgi:hypothetical protein